ncbi:MAG: DNA polymerase I [Planctomycetota bacterium]|nr:MAG: DNA polymerase I [Planctomycetota bacterium]REJ94450.1 MAG: DNA polymerase I [Planctomycetota bacterium]REK22097.1 MAG: DNA polymerase I [Planctomycetota bacterium]REK44561.1 MAG: DNA polymerase I [Planctomycetota bacterium]
MSARSRQASFDGFSDSPEEDIAAAKEPSKAGSQQVSAQGRNRPSRDPKRQSRDPKQSSTDDGDANELAGKTVYVVDSHSLIFQVFHALPEMTSPRGEPVSAIFGFVRDIFYLLESKHPDYLICAYDLPGETFRHAIYPKYKADRGEMPDELRPQIPAIAEVMTALGVPVISYPDHEADDVLATIARQCAAAGANCLLVTGDKDCRQLISDRVQIYNVRKDFVYGAAELAADWGIRPDQVVDFQALVGDSVDNIPGVPLIGPKIAGELIQKYGDLDTIFAHVDEVAGKKRQQNLRENRDVALMCRELVRLMPDLPLEVDWSAARVGGIDASAALELFTQFGFHSLGDRLAALDTGAAPANWQADYRAVTKQRDLDALIKRVRKAGCMSFDLETRCTIPHGSATWPRWADIVGYAVAVAEGEAYYIPVHLPPDESCLDADDVREALRPLLEDASLTKLGQNLKYEQVVLRTAGVELAGVDFDTMLASYLLEAGERSHSLDELAKRYLNHTNTKISELIGTGKNQKSMDEVPLADITAYAGEDADVPLRLKPLLDDKLREAELVDLFRELEMPLIEVLAELEFNGIRVDIARLAELSAVYGERIDALEAEIYELAGHPFNIASPKQLAQVLFQEQGLPVIKKTKTGASTDAGVLEQLAREHPLPAKIIEYRQFAKLKSTYVDALPNMVHPDTGRVHTSLNQVVAATGRLSSNDPNLQNIPVRSERGREIRSAFLPGYDGWKLLAADYSQIELRVLAHFSGDEVLIEAFARDEDIHALVASQIHDVPLDEVSSDQRRSAKAVNFGVIYGQSPFGLAKALDIDQDEAAAFIDAYFARYPRVDEFLREVLDRCRADGYVKTISGRRRQVTGIRADTSGRQRTLPERTAINTVIQGSAADLIKRAMITLYRRLRDDQLDSRMLLQVHDELIFEVPPHELDAMQQIVPEEMGAAGELIVPLKVDVSVGDNWAEL